MALTPTQNKMFCSYKANNPSLFSNRVIEEFFYIEEHVLLLLKSIEGDSNARKLLDEKFRRHFFRIRFVKYLSTTIKYCSIDHLRKNRKYEYRNQLIFDQPLLGKAEGLILGELLQLKYSETPNKESLTNPSRFYQTISNEHLAKAFLTLTEKQKYITTLVYVMSYQDNEVSKICGVSPQAVRKIRISALQKLRKAMIGRG
ncbi:sigma-70 family RNA polymerase sigma factor [Paenibacillus humicus]|uniref:sigma-70 family RNA polymerase sigma factor n=1 Tax=Paenibacillus humicus TaxID=412861 RepID=UPI003D2AEE62